MKNLFRKLGSLMVVAMLLLMFLSPLVEAQEHGIIVSFEKTAESPVDVTFRVTIENLSLASKKDMAMSTLIEEMSLPVSSLNQISIKQVAIEEYLVDVPAYGWIATANGTDEWGFIGNNPVLYKREVKEDYKDWYFKGNSPNTETTINLPSNDDDEYGFGPGVLTLDFNINTGIQRSLAGGWGSKGILVLDIAGTKYFDLSNSSFWDDSWTGRNVLSFNASDLAENLTDFPVTVFLDPTRVDFDNIASNGTDVRFVDMDNETSLPFHKAQWDDTGGSETATLIVRIPQIDAGSDYTDFFYIYYGNAGASEASDKVATWNGTGAVGVWPLYTEESNGSFAFDSTSNNNTGNITGAVWGSTGRTGDGDDSIAVAAAAELDMTDNITIMAWYFSTNATDFRAVVGKGDNTVGGGSTYNVQVESSGAGGQMRYFITDGSGEGEAYAQTTSSIPTDSWVLLAVTFNPSSDNISLYIDGALDKQTTITDTPASKPGEDFYMMARDAGGLTQHMIGTLGEARLFDRILSGQEIQYLMLSEQFLFTGHDGGFINYAGIQPEFTISTGTITGITMDRNGVTGGTFRGSVDSLGTGPVANVTFQYGLTSGLGTFTANQTANTTGNYTQAVPVNLTPGATYFWQAFGTSVNGTSNGTIANFTFTMPTFVTSAISAIDIISSTTATLNGNVSDMGVASDFFADFQYGPTVSYGTTTTAQTLSSTGPFSEVITDFPWDITLHTRARATVGAVTENGSDVSASIGNRLSTYAGLPDIVGIIPIIVFTAFVLASGLVGFQGVRRVRAGDPNTGQLMFAVALVLLAVGIILFNVIITVLDNLRTGNF